jgi:hypothetical protein
MIRNLLYFVLFFGLTAPGFAQQSERSPLTADVLKAKLFAKTTDELRFCDDIIQKRDEGTIPPQLIYGVYRKALTKEPARRFMYFKTGLEIMCQREGIVLAPSRPSSPSSSWRIPAFVNPFR